MLRIVLKTLERQHQGYLTLGHIGRSALTRRIHVSSNEELSFAIITPKSLAKAHTGGILARLLVIPGIRLVGARIYSPSDAMKQELFQATKEAAQETGYTETYTESLLKYYDEGLTRDACEKIGIRNRVMMLLFAGKDTRNKLVSVVGDNIPSAEEYGRTIRGTYGDYSMLPSGEIITFEPSVLVPHTSMSNRKKLAIFAKYADVDGGIMPQHTPNGKGVSISTALVIVKPDNFQRPSSLPGHILDLFGTTGLPIVAIKVFAMSLNQAKQFYGFLEDVFVEKLGKRVETTLRERLSSAFDFPISDQNFAQMRDVLKRDTAKAELTQVINFMTGIDSQLQSYAERKHFDEPGNATCLAVLYRGPRALEVIRDKLGSTDPTKAEAGTIRSDYGHDLMRNGAHASDSQDSVERERKIIGLDEGEKSREKMLVVDWLKATETEVKFRK